MGERVFHLRKTCRMGNPCSILLIEDDQVMAASLQNAAKVYEPGCFQITNAVDILDATNKFHAFPYDLLILDLGLPGTEGLATLLTIRDFIGFKVPIAVLTDLDDEEVELRCFETGVIAYVVKPVVNVQHFLRRCRGWVLKHRRDMQDIRALSEENVLLREAAAKISLNPGEARTEVIQIAETLFALARAIETRYKGHVANS